MNEREVFWTRLYLQVVNTLATAIATGEVTFQLLSGVLSHDLASLSLLIALGSNVMLLALAASKAPEKRPESAHDFEIIAPVLQALNELRLRSGLDPLVLTTLASKADSSLSDKQPNTGEETTQ